MASVVVDGVYVKGCHQTFPICCLQLISFTLLWQSWYYHSAIGHLSDGDGESWMHAVHSQLHSISPRHQITHNTALLPGH